jgi:hypothetical protein
VSATISRLPVDPDLERAMGELAHVAARLRQIEEQLVVQGADHHYSQYGHRIVQRDDAWAAIAGRAEILNIRPGSLRLFIEEHARLRKQMGRRPSLAQLQRAVMTAVDVRKRDLATRLADEAVAKFRARHASKDFADAEGAATYLEACRG